MSTDTLTKTQDTEAEIADYLASNPDFFERHTELLNDLHIPHERGRALSLIERQVALLREEKARYSRQLNNLVSIARENDLLTRRLHRLTLALIEAGTFDELMNTLQDELHDEFRADAVEVRLFSPHALDEKQDTGDHTQGATAFRDFFDKGMPVCGPLEGSKLRYLFGAGSTDIRSAAIIPLKAEGVLGLLAIGSRQAERFTPHKGTDFLVRLGEIVSRLLQAVSLPGV